MGEARPAPADGTPDATARERWLGWAWMAGGAAVALLLLYLLAPMLAPFVLAAVLAYGLQPGMDWLLRHRCPAPLAGGLMVLLCAGVAAGLLFVLVPVVEREGAALVQRAPAILDKLNTELAPRLEQWLGISVRFDPDALQALARQQVGQQDLGTLALAKFGSGGLALLQVLGTLVLVPVVLFYLLLDGRDFAHRLEAVIPRRWHAPTLAFLGEIDQVLAQFLRGQITVMVLLALYYSSALAIAGFESALAIGLLTGLLIFIPYVGFTLGLLLATVVALLQFPPLQAGVSLALVYGFGQILEGFILTPRLVGQRIGLHPLAVIFALLAFAQVFGFVGVLVALPASAVLLVALRHVRSAYLASAFFNRP